MASESQTSEEYEFPEIPEGSKEQIYLCGMYDGIFDIDWVASEADLRSVPDEKARRIEERMNAAVEGDWGFPE